MTTRMLREMDVVEADRIPQEWFLSAPPAQRILQVTDAVVAPSMDVRFAQDWRGLETLTKAGELIGWADGQPIRTPYDNCTLVMPSLRQLRSEERSVGKEWVSKGRFRGAPYHKKKKQ